MTKKFIKSLNYDEEMTFLVKRNANIDELMESDELLIASIKLLSMGPKYCKYEITIDPNQYVFAVRPKSKKSEQGKTTNKLINKECTHEISFEKKPKVHELTSLVVEPLIIECAFQSNGSVALNETLASNIKSHTKGPKGASQEEIPSVKEILKYEPAEETSLANIKDITMMLSHINFHITKGLLKQFEYEDIKDKKLELEYAVEQQQIRFGRA